MRSLLICIAMLFTQQAMATVYIHIYESGGHVGARLWGSLNLDAVGALVGTTSAYDGYSPITGILSLNSASVDQYDIDVANWTSFGSGSFGNWDSSSGDAWAMFTISRVGVPAGYVSRDELAATATKFGATIASLGFTSGTYVTTSDKWRCDGYS